MSTRMRALVMLCLPFVMILSFSDHGSTAAGPQQSAFASWQRPHGLSYAQATEAPDGVGESLGTLGSIGCSRPKTCIGASITARLEPDAFTVDPSLAEASLTMPWAGADQVVAWTGEGDYSPTFEPGSFQAEMSREAESEGTILGREFPGDPSQSFLEQGTEGEPDTPMLVGYAVSKGPRFMSPVGKELVAGGDACITFKAPERKFARLANAERAKKDRGKLKLDPELGKVARKHTGEMIDKDLLYHTAQNDLLTRIVGWDILGENVGVGGTVASLHEAFMDSTPHRRNILYRDYERFGIGVAKGHDRMWVTVIFQAGVNPDTTLNCG
jgi:hypothetical protein